VNSFFIEEPCFIPLYRKHLIAGGLMQEDEPWFGLYSIGGYRQVTEDGAVIGSFTDQKPPQEVTDRKSKVYFFRIEPANASR
jgi:hypothetical protein